MTFKKGLLAAATATTVAIAGTGIASAQDDTPETPPTEETSSSAELLGSIEGSTETLTIFNDFGGAVAGSISILPDVYSAIQDFQDMVDDITSNFPPLPF